MPRNYRKEYDSYHKSSTQKKKRASRNTARSKMVKAGKAKKVMEKMLITRTEILVITLEKTLR